MTKSHPVIGVPGINVTIGLAVLVACHVKSGVLVPGALGPVPEHAEDEPDPTVMLTASDVVDMPALSVAFAVSEYVPAATPLQLYE